MKKNNLRTKKASSLMEVVIAVAVFAIIVVAVAGIFSSSIFGYRNAKSIQKNLEDAQFAMNLMEKSFRTSSIISGTDTTKTVRIYNYSKGKDRCEEFSIVDKRLKTGSADIDNPAANPNWRDDCLNAPITLSVMAQGIDSGNFFVAPSSSGVVGRVIVSMQVCALDSAGNCLASVPDRARIQTSVSLRDYNVSGL